MAEKLLLRTALGKHQVVEPLRDGRVVSDRVAFDFVDYNPLPQAFRAMVRGNELDVAELAIITHLLAHHYAKPLVGIAIPLWSRLPHANLVCGADSSIATPRDLNGTRVGVRAYAQTSGVWVRGILKSEYGVDLDSITWVTMEDAHLTEYADPPHAVRDDGPLALRPLMLSGALSAIMGERIVDPAGIRNVIQNADTAAREWMTTTGFFPINHVLTVRAPLIDQHPWLGAELMRLFTEARAISQIERDSLEPPAYGLAANRRSLQLAYDYAADQRITPHAYRVDDLFLDL